MPDSKSSNEPPSTTLSETKSAEKVSTSYPVEKGAAERIERWNAINVPACPRCGDKFQKGAEHCSYGLISGCPVLDGVM